MKHDVHREKALVQAAIDDCLSGVDNMPSLLTEVMRKAKGEEKVKKKLSLGLVLMIVLLLAAVGALAAALWEQQVVPMKEIEKSQGDYINWNINQKQTLIKALLESGSLAPSDETAKLLSDETDEAAKHLIADQLVLALTGQTDAKEITVDIITYAIMGATDYWTPEQRVWWQEITQQYHGDEGCPDTLIVPDQNDLTQAQAIAIAKAAILKAYAFSPDALDQAVPVAILYVTQQRPDYKRWDVQFKFFREGTKNYLERVYTAVVDENGHVIADDDVGVSSVEDAAQQYRETKEKERSAIVQTYRSFADKGNSAPIQQWPLALKAAYSEQVRPMVLSALSSGKLTAYEDESTSMEERNIIASTVFAYGMPSEGDMSEAAAKQKANQLLQERYGYNEADFLYTFVYFDVTDSSRPLWRFVYLPANHPNATIHHLYRIELDARTGETVGVEQIQEQSQIASGSLEYDKKLY